MFPSTGMDFGGGSNLVLLCRRHHRLLHEGGFKVERRPGGGAAVQATRRSPHPGRARSRARRHRELLRLGRRSTRVIGPETPVALDHGGRFSLDMAVDGLLASEGLLDAGARDRDSVLGRYSIDEQALTTSAAYGRLAVVDGQLVWD